MKKECNLCNFKDSETLVHEGRYCIVALCKDPLTRYHLLIFPKGHYSQLGDLPDKVSCSLTLLAKRISFALRKVAEPAAISYLADEVYSKNRVGYRTHFVLHLLPIYKRDPLLVDWTLSTPLDAPILAHLAQELRKFLW